MCSIENLPNEIIYRIFENLDVLSIINFCLTSKTFYLYLNKYNLYKINFESILKKDFNLIIRLINPINIISIKLNDNDKTPGIIKLFIQNFHLNKLTRLKCLELIKINENDLESILKSLEYIQLNKLIIEYQEYFTMLNKSTINILNKIISNKYIYSIYLDMKTYQYYSFDSNILSNIQYLTLINSNLFQFIEIIKKNNKLKSISLINFNMKNLNNISFNNIDLNQLKSFKIEQTEFIIEIFNLFILYLININYLTLNISLFLNENFLFENNFLNLFENKFNNLIDLNLFICFKFNEFNINYNKIKNLLNEQINKFKLKSNINYDINKYSNEIDLYTLPCLNKNFIYINKLENLFINNSSNQRFLFVHQLELNLSDLNIQLISNKVFFSKNKT